MDPSASPCTLRASRFDIVDGPDSQGYISLLDNLRARKFKGRYLPNIPVVQRNLEKWVGLRHPAFVRILAAYQDASRVLVLMDDFNAEENLAHVEASRLKVDEVASIFLRICRAMDFLSFEGIQVPRLSLSCMTWEPETGLRLFGQESASSEHPHAGESVLDLRYAAPELVHPCEPEPASAVFQAAALFIHFMTGNPHRHDRPFEPLTPRYRKLKGHWDNLLQAMVCPDPSQRPSFKQVEDTVFELLPSGANQKLKHEPLILTPRTDREVLGELQALALSSRQGMCAAMLETLPGAERVRRLMPLMTECERQGMAIIHWWSSRPCQHPYRGVNELIKLADRLLQRHAHVDALRAELVSISEWQTPGQVATKWSRLVRRLTRFLLSHYRGLVVVVEDVHHLDEASLEALLAVGSWTRQLPLFFAFTCRHIAETKANRLREAWPSPMRVFDVPRISESQLRAMVHPSNHARAAAALQTRRQHHAREAMVLRALDTPAGHLEPPDDLHETVWRDMPSKEQLVFKLLTLSHRRLSLSEMERTMRMKGLRCAVSALVTKQVIEHAPELAAHKIRDKGLASWCRARLDGEERHYVARQLMASELAEEAPDPAQLLSLSLTLNDHEQVRQWGARLQRQIQKHWDTQQLLRIQPLLHSGEYPDLSPLAQLLALHQGVTRRLKTRIPVVWMNTWRLALIASHQGEIRKADDYFRRLGATQNAPMAARAHGWCRSAVLTALQDYSPGVTRAWREFRNLDLQEVLDPWPAIWEWSFQHAFRSCGFTLESPAQASRPDWLQAWDAALSLWENNQFEPCIDEIECALPGLQQHGDLNWLADAHRLMGNAYYRCNHPDHAIRCYDQAKRIYLQSGNDNGLDAMQFNQATSHKLAGRFPEAVKHFEPIVARAKKQGDSITLCQSLYNLLVIALLQCDFKRLEAIFQEHQKLARRLKDRDEQIKGLSARLHGALLWSKSDVMDMMAELVNLLESHDPFPLLADEAAFALRLARFSLGEPDTQNDHAGEYTRWRHAFLDALQGCREPEWDKLLQNLGNGLFQAYHLFLIKSALETKALPSRHLPEALGYRFARFAQQNHAHMAAFLRDHFSRQFDARAIPPEFWERAMEVMDAITWWQKDSQTIQNTVLRELQAIWPFHRMGCALRRAKQWCRLDLPGGSPTWDALLKSLEPLTARLNEGPLQTAVAREQNGQVWPFLLLPFKTRDGETAVFWAESSHDTSGDMHISLKALLRLYSKLMEYAVDLDSGQVQAGPKRHPQNASPDDLGIVGHHDHVQSLRNQIRILAPTNLNVHIFGESGTGKELAARALCHLSDRARRPFRAVNCSQYPEQLIESHLFGHVKGSFTGASSDRVGLLELVDGGTLFLDEVGDLNPRAQSLLLRVIQQGEFTRVGEHQVRRSDIRFITATNVDLQELMDRKRFRLDLYFRIAEEQLLLAPLRERLEDIPDLAYHFANKHQSLRKVGFSPCFLKHLTTYHWPGNIRELESYIRRVLIHHPKAVTITQSDALPFLLPKIIENTGPTSVPRTLADIEAHSRSRIISERLREFKGNRTHAARSLGISRQRLVSLIKDLGIQGVDSGH